MSTESTTVYGPRRGKRWWYCTGTFAVGGIMAANEWPKPLLHAATNGAPPGNLTADLGAGFFLLLGCVLLLGIIKGLPRLVIDRDGIVVHTTFLQKSARWRNLGAFSIVAVQGRRASKSVRAVAPFVRLSTKQVAIRTVLTIPDAFDVPLETILRDIATWRRGVFADGSSIGRDSAMQSRPYGVAGFRFPWLTAVLLAVFIGIFVIEQRFAVMPGGQALSPAVNTLIALGGLSRTLVQSGQWYRLLTAPFLHAGVAHLAANGIAFALSGYALERLVGRAWMFCIFAAGALAGSAVSLALSTPSTISVGASGAVMAMLVALFIISFRLPSGRAKTVTQIQSARVAVPALIPISHGAAALHVDYGAHFGGAALGAFVGLLVLRTWRDGSPLPRFRSGAIVLASLAALCFVGSAAAVALRYPSYASLASMIPPALYPKNAADVVARWNVLLATYPNDPRSHLLAASVKAQQGDASGAEQEYRAALQLAEASPFVVRPSLTNTIRGALAVTVLGEGRQPEALAIAQQACAARDEARPGPYIATALAKSGLCASGDE